MNSYCRHLIRQLFTSVINNNVKRFSEIPGPNGPFKFGTILNYLPIVGTYKWDELHKNGLKNLKMYGSLVREKLLPGVYILWIFDPKDIAVVVNESSPGVYPRRRSHLALEKYRKNKPDIYRTGGLLPT